MLQITQINLNLKSMRIKQKEQEQQDTKLYVVDEQYERTVYDTVYKYLVDKETLKKYFPNWDIGDKYKPKLQPKRKNAGD